MQKDVLNNSGSAAGAEKGFSKGDTNILYTLWRLIVRGEFPNLVFKSNYVPFVSLHLMFIEAEEQNEATHIFKTTVLRTYVVYPLFI